MTILLFDAGGVLLELGPPPIKNEWLTNEQSISAIWNDWLGMSTARKFEAGKMSADEFALEMIETLQLKTDTAAFIEHFRAWPIAPFSGTRQWLIETSKQYHTAMLSNTNELHWRRMKDDMGLGDVLNDYFLSHKLGLVKPDKAIYDKVVELLNVPASDIVFFDDNIKNIRAASDAGLRGVHVQGAEQLRAAVAQL